MLSLERYEDLSSNFPTRDDLRFGEVENRLLVRKPWHLPLYLVTLWFRYRSVAKHSHLFVI